MQQVPNLVKGMGPADLFITVSYIFTMLVIRRGSHRTGKIFRLQYAKYLALAN